MNADEVEELEQTLEQAITDVLRRRQSKKIAGTSRHTCHLMAKAAVSVLEAVNAAPPRRRPASH